MTVLKHSDDDKEYASVAGDDGDNYRELAEMLSYMGYDMNHTSARNYVVRIMKKFAETFSERFGSEKKSEAVMYKIARDPMFQSGMSELLHLIEQDRRARVRRGGGRE